jgi:hypothetical protein
VQDRLLQVEVVGVGVVRGLLVIGTPGSVFYVENFRLVLVDGRGK